MGVRASDLGVNAPTPPSRATTIIFGNAFIMMSHPFSE